PACRRRGCRRSAIGNRSRRRRRRLLPATRKTAGNRIMYCCDGSGSSPRVAGFCAGAPAAKGGGPVRPCPPLANALAADCWTTIFACTRMTPRIVPQLAAAGYRHIAVEPDASPEIDALRAGLPDGCDVLVIDHYGAGAVLDRACRGWARHITVIED